MRRFVLSSVLLGALSLSAAVSTPASTYLSSPADSSLLTEKFSVDGSTAVPGTVLKSGSYVIRVVDHMSDRSIIRIEREDGKVVSTFLAVPNRQGGSVGPVSWTGGSDKDKALRGFNFPGSYSVEFVYPKAEAVKIATAHSAAVEAIDPASDNLPSKQNKLSDEDMKMVTLWTLSPTRVNGTTAIAAEKYKPSADAATPPVTVARNEPPAAPYAQRTQAAPAPAASPSSASSAANSTTPPAKPVRRHVATALPHTASELPVVLLAGMLSLLGIAAIRGRAWFTGR